LASSRRYDRQSRKAHGDIEQFVQTRLLIRYATVLTWDPHLAEDIVQNVLIRVQSRWSRIEPATREQYVKANVLNEFLSWRRRR
jgi:DNA-directed RNA polymerase specialized sigma24 family protein